MQKAFDGADRFVPVTYKKDWDIVRKTSAGGIKAKSGLGGASMQNESHGGGSNQLDTFNRSRQRNETQRGRAQLSRSIVCRTG
jgi:hypothetical protein